MKIPIQCTHYFSSYNRCTRVSGTTLVLIIFCEFMSWHFRVTCALVQNAGSCPKTMVLPITKGWTVAPIYTFDSLVSYSDYQCAELYLRRKRCRSANFVAEEHVCHLNSVDLSDISINNAVDNARHMSKAIIQTVSIAFSLG